MDKVFKQKLIHWNNRTKTATNKKLLGEEPLSISIEGKPYAVVMRTPGDEFAHVAGFCLTEGIIDTPDDLTSIGFCEDDDSNVVTLTLTPARRKQIPEIMDRRGFISQTSCGICGKELVEELYQIIKPVPDDPLLDSSKACACLENLTAQQSLRRQTKASHAAVLYNAHYELLSVAEDVGRHNALDKLIGWAFLNKKLPFHHQIIMVSGRASFELLQKCLFAGAPIFCAVLRIMRWCLVFSASILLKHLPLNSCGVILVSRLKRASSPSAQGYLASFSSMFVAIVAGLNVS